MANQLILVTGNPVDGFTFTGPFDSQESIGEAGEKSGADWWIAHLQSASTVVDGLPKLEPGSPEPLHGSVVMTQSTTGTAFQRHFSDGLWHSTTGQVKQYADLFQSADGRDCAVFLLYAPEGTQ